MAYQSTRLRREFEINELVTVHYFEYPLNFAFHGESHDFWEFLYVDRGGIRVTAGDQELMLSAGQAIFHEPWEFHAFRSVGKRPPNLVVVSFCCDSPFLDFFRQAAFTLSEEERELISKLLAAAVQCFATPLNAPAVEKMELNPDAPPGCAHTILLYLELFLLTVYRSRAQTRETIRALRPLDGGTDERPPGELADEIVTYLQLHITEKVSLPQICSAFSISHSRLERIFHAEKGCGVIDYFIRMKIDRAKELIRNDAMNITELAYHLSFASPQYFSLRFKRAVGMSPREFQSSVKGISMHFS
jgi:AraC-like DNA-binding protein